LQTARLKFVKGDALVPIAQTASARLLFFFQYYSVDVPANLLYNDSPSRVQRSSYSPGTSKDGHNFIDAVVRKPKSARYFFSINNTIFVTLELCFCRSDSDNVICSKTVTPNCANVFDVIRSEEAYRKRRRKQAYLMWR